MLDVLSTHARTLCAIYLGYVIPIVYNLLRLHHIHQSDFHIQYM